GGHSSGPRGESAQTSDSHPDRWTSPRAGGVVFRALAVGFILGETLKDLRRVGRLGVSAVLLITLSLGALGGFWLLSLNLERAIGQWRNRIRLVGYLKAEPPAAGRDDLVRRIQAIAGVQAVHYVSKDEALRSLKQVLGKQADVTEQLPANPLPASVEV